MTTRRYAATAFVPLLNPAGMFSPRAAVARQWRAWRFSESVPPPFARGTMWSSSQPEGEWRVVDTDRRSREGRGALLQPPRTRICVVDGGGRLPLVPRVRLPNR